MVSSSSRVCLEPAHAIALLALLVHVLFGVPSLSAAQGPDGRLVATAQGALCLSAAPNEALLAGKTLPSPGEHPAGHHGVCCMPGCSMSGSSLRTLPLAEAWTVPMRLLSSRSPDEPHHDGRGSGALAHAATGPRGPPRVVVSA